MCYATERSPNTNKRKQRQECEYIMAKTMNVLVTSPMIQDGLTGESFCLEKTCVETSKNSLIGMNIIWDDCCQIEIH